MQLRYNVMFALYSSDSLQLLVCRSEIGEIVEMGNSRFGDRGEVFIETSQASHATQRSV